MRRPILLILLSTLSWAVPGSASAALDQHPAAPQLLLNADGRADWVYPGDVFATLGNVGLFHFWEHNDGDSVGGGVFDDDTVVLPVWRTDGTTEGTFPLLPPGSSLYYISDTVDGKLLLGVCESPQTIPGTRPPACPFTEPVQLWVTDGTREGTVQLLTDDPRHLVSFVRPRGVPELGLFFFATFGEETGYELWATDGTPEGARVLLSTESLGFRSLRWLLPTEETLTFGATLESQATGFPFWIGRTDGTPEGTKVFPTPFDEREIVLYNVTPDGGGLLLLGRDVLGPDLATGYVRAAFSLWSLAADEETVRPLGSLGEHVGTVTTWIRAVNGRGFVELYESDNLSRALWGSDGTPEGTEFLSSGPENPHVLLRPSIETVSLAGSRAFVGLPDAEHGLEPWATDATPEGTVRLADLCPGPCDSSPRELAIAGTEHYLFSATDGVHGHEVWRWTPRTDRVEMVADLCPGECSGQPRLVGRTADGRVLVAAYNPEEKRALWEIDAEAASATLVAELGEFEIDRFPVLFTPQPVLWGLTDSHWIFWGRSTVPGPLMLSVPVGTSATAPPPGPALTSDALPGFAVKVRIGGEDGILGRVETACLPETLCVSGAIAGRSEVFVRVVGPKPNGRLWPTLVKFSTSPIEVWIEQVATGLVRYYRLEGASPGSSELPGLFDRDGFPPS